MKEGYIPQEQRKNILLLTDDIRLQSGVANVGKEIVLHTAHHYNWYNLGGAINHPELGKIFDISEDINKVAGITDSKVMVQPNNGYGDPESIRRLIKDQNIDAIFLITDPRYFTWLFSMENEVRKKLNAKHKHPHADDASKKRLGPGEAFARHQRDRQHQAGNRDGCHVCRPSPYKSVVG